MLGGKLTEKVDYVRVLKVGLWLFAASGVLYLISNRMWQLIVDVYKRQVVKCISKVLNLTFGDASLDCSEGDFINSRLFELS